MIKVYLPINNNNIDSYFNTKEASRDITKINKAELDKIISLSLGSKFSDYEIAFEKRSHGQYIIVETDSEKKWITLSADYTTVPGDGGSNNAYFVEFIPMAIASYYLDKTSKAKSMELYLKGTNHNRAKTKGQQFYYRLAKTVGIKILNEFDFETEIRKNISIPFKSIEEWKKARKDLSSANRSNKPSYIIENGDSYIFYGKTFGANGRESIFILYVLANLALKENKRIFLYEVEDNGSLYLESSSSSREPRFKKILKDLNVVYYADSIKYVENEEDEDISDENKDSRCQAEFMKNLLYKYNCKRDDKGNVIFGKNGKPVIADDTKRCYLCHCDIQNLIIASHIHRICDINKLEIPFEEKRAMAVDADNGLWLCANHDKLFEYGLIYFENNKMIISNRLNDMQKDFVQNITFNTSNEEIKENLPMITEKTKSCSLDKDFYIDEKDYNENMHKYLEIHKNRVLK